jgi:hypothetical protein
MFKAYTGKFPCIYLFELGTVGSLRELYSISPDIPDDVIVYKYGFTDDIVRRFTEHTNDYGKLKDVNVYLSLFTLIDVKYTSDAENHLRQLLKGFNKALPVEGKKELITLNTKELNIVKQQFDMLSNKYSGSTQGLQKIIEELKQQLIIKDMVIQNNILELKNKDLELKLELKNKDLELKYKDLEVQNKELQLQMYLSRG